MRSNPNANSIGDAAGICVPLFGTWRRAYLVVVVIFLVELAFFSFVSRYFL